MNEAFSSPVPSRMKQAMRMLDRWSLAASADGTLWISPRRSPVPFVECCTLLKRLGEIIRSRPLRTVILDLGDADIPEDRWPVLLGILGVLAEEMHARLRIVSYADAPAQDDSTLLRTGQGSVSSVRATSAAQLKSSCIVLEVPAQMGPRAIPA